MAFPSDLKHTILEVNQAWIVLLRASPFVHHCTGAKLHYATDTNFINLINTDIQHNYAPNDAKQQRVFFKDLQNHLAEFTQENMIIVGDFNCALTNKDKKGGNPISRKALVIKEIEQLANLFDLKDILRLTVTPMKRDLYGETNLPKFNVV